MDHVQHSFDHFGLHLAAMAGDDEGVRRALDMGADINGLDEAGRTAVMCAVAGNHWQNINASFLTPKRLNTIRLLLGHPDISLFTLNAPQSSMNGVIPLGMAAWLNLPDAVRLLLEDSAHTVSVDGMDSHGATALMYAARDSNLEVVQCLLFHGARPDFRDCNHRSSIQFALAHPQILWLCESILRRHRWRESQSADRNKLLFWTDGLQELATSSLPSDCLAPPPLAIFTNKALSRLTNTLISSIVSSDLSFLHSLLFAPTLPPSSPAALYPMSAPVLVNRHDSHGWAPIHYCVSMEYPCMQALDALYCAGAEVSLFTTEEHYTPLHILAQSANLPVEDSELPLLLDQFTVHLIHDLHAPLSARDKNDETCIHIAAERGNCINLLMIFLNFDTTGYIRELRNSRGLTALEICKPEFSAAFGDDAEKLRSVSSLSSRTIRPVRSFTSLASFSEWQSAGLDDSISLHSPVDFDVEGSIHQLLSYLRATSPTILHRSDPEHLGYLTKLVCESSELNYRILNHFRSRVLEAAKEVQRLQDKSQKIRDLLDLLTQAASDRLRERGFDPWPLDSKPRDSADSENTAVASQGSRSRSSSIAKPAQIDDHHTSVATQTTPLSGETANLPSKSTYNFHLASLAEIEREIAEHSAASDKEGNMTASPRPDVKLKQLVRKKKKVEDRIREIESDKKLKKDSVTHGTSKLKAWIKRIISYDRPTKLEIVMDIDEDSAVGREARDVKDFSGLPCEAIYLGIDGALHTSHIVLRAAQRDLLTILQCLNSADEFITLANHSITRAERVIKRAAKKRETMISNLRHSASASDSSDGVRRNPGTPGALGYSNLLSLQPSIMSLSSVYSSYSHASAAPTLMENDDEDTRALRRLLLRKIEAGVVGSWDEMDKAMNWLRIVKEVVRGVKRRTYLL